MSLGSRFLGVAVALVLCAPASPQQRPAAPQGPAYNVEIVIFRATTALGAPENWSLQAGAGLGTPPASSSPQGERLIGKPSQEQLQLADVVSRLRNSGSYEPVAHVAWTQTASPWGTRAGLPVEQLGIDVPGLTGNVYLERGQYLHLGMTLSYQMPEPPAGIGAGPGTIFSLADLRRVRFNERTYYDHPAFGVIAVVTPVR